ncbi:hypothetical protein [Cribrihabitans pelagius]
MIGTFLTTLAALAIVLYAQAWFEARGIRRNRRRAASRPLILHPPER